MNETISGRELDKAVAVSFGHNVKETELGWYRLYDAQGYEETDEFPSASVDDAWNTCDSWSSERRVGHMLMMIRRLGWRYRLNMSQSVPNYIVCEVFYNDHECARSEGIVEEGTAICRAYLTALAESGTSAIPTVIEMS